MKRANVAYAQTFENQLKEHKPLIEDIERRIDLAIAQGKTFAYIDKVIPLSVATMLDSYGYTLRKVGTWHEVVWG